MSYAWGLPSQHIERNTSPDFALLADRWDAAGDRCHRAWQQVEEARRIGARAWEAASLVIWEQARAEYDGLCAALREEAGR